MFVFLRGILRQVPFVACERGGVFSGNPVFALSHTKCGTGDEDTHFKGGEELSKEIKSMYKLLAELLFIKKYIHIVGVGYFPNLPDIPFFYVARYTLATEVRRNNMLSG